MGWIKIQAAGSFGLPGNVEETKISGHEGEHKRMVMEAIEWLLGLLERYPSKED